MRRIGLVACLLVVVNILGVGRVWGQEHENKIYIACAVEFVELATDRGIPLTEENCIADFIVSVKRELEALNYHVIVEPEITAETDLIADMVGATQGVVLLSVQSTASAYMELSPILYNHLETPSSFYTGTAFSFFVGQYHYYPNEQASDMAMALVLYDQNHCSEANTYFSNLEGTIENTEDNFMYHAIQFFRGNCELRAGNFEKAAIFFEKGVTYVDATWGSVEISTNLAWTYVQLGKNDKAFDVLDTLVEASIDTYTHRPRIEALRSRALIRALAYDYSGAIEDMDRVIQVARVEGYLGESLAELYTLRGKIIFLIYEWDRVLDNFNTALEYDPNYAPAYFQRGVLYYTMAQRENALADFQHYLELAPDGENAAEAQQYSESIKIELDALENG